MKNINCVFCKKKLTGRVDKQFCNDQCRAAFHNNNKDCGSDYMQIINVFIKKNRTILKSIFEQGFCPVHTQDLLISGFRFSFFTHVNISKSGDVYRFCYDYGYIINKDETVLIIKTNKRV